MNCGFLIEQQEVPRLEGLMGIRKMEQNEAVSHIRALPFDGQTDRQEVGGGETGSWSQCFRLFGLNLQPVGAGGPMGRAAASGRIPACGRLNSESR